MIKMPHLLKVFGKAARQKRGLERRALEFCSLYADVLGCSSSDRPDAKRVLVIGGGSSSRVEMELCLIKALERSGARPLVLRMHNWEELSPYYSLLPPSEIHFWKDYCHRHAFHSQAETVLNGSRSLDELLAFRCGPVRVGGHAVSTARRDLGLGTLDPQLPSTRARLRKCFAVSMAAVTAVNRIIEELHPSLILTQDTAYTPRGEILDTCVDAGIPVISWYTAHKSSAMMLRRYTAINRDADLNSLSDASWRIVRKMDWENKSEELNREFSTAYASKNWYNDEGMNFEKRILDIETVRERLCLDPSKKTAFIFPHVGWDASFGRGHDLFQNYDEWFVATVKAACANERLQWVIKIHPTHVGKFAKVVNGRAVDEEEMLRSHFDNLPPHVTIIPAHTDISTFSLFPVMDYCLTVRGTVGIEAACAGIPVLTGGTGRYARRGFTVDSATPDEYLKRIADIGLIPELTPIQIELAQRFAYGLFLLRPLPLSSVTMTDEFDKKNVALGRSGARPLGINIKSHKDWDKAIDLMAFADWALNSDEEDFLLSVPSAETNLVS